MKHKKYFKGGNVYENYEWLERDWKGNEQTVFFRGSGRAWIGHIRWNQEK